MPLDIQILIDEIDGHLPQTQCGQCGYAGCKPYAAALAANEADINQCPPGGDAGIRTLAALLRREYKPLSREHGIERPRSLALIDEQTCIGCTLCIEACPVDAIVGASKLMHTVISSLCTGCELCVPPCPVDCIRMEPIAPARTWTKADANAARVRFEFRQFRLSREADEKAVDMAARFAALKSTAATRQ